MSKKKKGTIIISVLSFFVLLLVGSFIYAKLSTITFYARVKESYQSSSIIEPIESERIFKDYPVIQINKGSFNPGDLIKISIKKNLIETYPPVAYVKDYKVIIDNTTSTTEFSKTTTSTTTTTTNAFKEDIITTKKATTTTKKALKTTGVKKIVTTTENYSDVTSKDEIVLKTLQEHNNLVEVNKNNKSFKEKAKEFFTSGIDFIFYDEPIKGVYFKDLTNKANLKAVGLLLKLDTLIDNNYPDLKNDLSNKYQNVKNKLIELYLNKTSEYCANHDDVCEEAKTDFGLLKYSTNITWETIKSLGSNGIKKLKEWYEIYSGK